MLFRSFLARFAPTYSRIISKISHRRGMVSTILPFSLHGFPAPSRRRFQALPCGVIAGYPMQTVMRFSRCGARFGNKKSPHNNLNLTIPSGMALVRVRYVAIRKLKTCSGSFGSRAGTLSKYVILNCWNRLPHKSSFVNKKF